jgi:NhaC family Na+:H+ antiporter
MKKTSHNREITFIEAIVMLLVYVIIFASGIGKYPTGLSILMCAIFTSLYGILVLKISWDEIFASILKMFQMGMPSLLVLLMVGFISASWLASGTIPALIVYGLKILNPSIFLVASFLITTMVGIATGSSWSVVATFGVALIGIANGMGIPPGLAGGAIVCGCWLGDKWSPLSDTTNLGAAMNGLNIFDLWKHMLPTSGLGGVGAAVIFAVIGFHYAGGKIDTAGINTLTEGINGQYHISLLLLLPVVLVIFFSVRQKPVLPVLILGVVVAVILAVVVQGKNLGDVMNAIYNGYTTSTGDAGLDKLLSGGGLLSVAGIMMIIFCAFTLAGALEPVGAMRAIAVKLGSIAKKRGPLTLLTVFTGIFGTYLGGTAYTGVILNSSMYADSYEKAGLTKLDLARASLEGSGHTSALVPWCGSHVMIVTSLGITWGQFLPYYFSFWISISLMILYGFTGWFFQKEKTEVK